ncbi:MAG TPA: beta-ketoacyl-[acyl-carrier-protein] synthase II, partial [Candidatus Binataceae bacterium]|nr:beta-ketoacyl-[acyl-carrier-protein] synthase II [Candidatus Binataceae bacterium]
MSPLGIGTEETWLAAREGRNGISRIQQFDPTGFACQIAGEVKDFDPARYVERKEIKKMGRFIQFGIAAAEFAMAQSGLKIDAHNAERAGVFIGSGIGGFEVIEREHKTLLEKGPGRISPFFIPATIVNLAAGHVSIRTGAKGPNSATATACTSGAHAVGDSFKIIQRGDADVMICGGAEAAVTPMSIGGFAAMRALSQRNHEPERASRPWDAERDGFVVGEGAGILVLEELEQAQSRGANILAEIVGYGMSGDAHHITSPAEDGDGAFRVMQLAVRDAGIEPHKIDYINAHGTSTDIGDRIETKAIKRVFC